MDEGEDGIKQFAYFRELTHTHQFELIFNIDTEIPKLGAFKEEMKAVRGITDNVGSLLQHTKNKILKILKDSHQSNENINDILNDNYQIPVSLKTNKKHVKNNMDLIALHKNLLREHFYILEVFNQSYIILPNAPLIKQVKLPPVLYTNSCIQPIKFSAIFTENQKSLFIWYKSKDKVDWTEVGKGYYYKTSQSDIGFYLKLFCKPINKMGIWGPPADCLSDVTVQKMGSIPLCPFENRQKFTRNKLTNPNE